MVRRAHRTACACAVAAVVDLLASCTSFGTTADVTDVAADGGADTGAVESGPPGDDAGARAFCATLSPTPRFCADFDGPTPIGFGWDGVRQGQDNSGAGGRVVREAALSVSPPSSALAQLDADGGGCVYADLKKSVHTSEGAIDAIRLAFSLRFGDAGSPKLSEIVSRMDFSAADGGAPCFLFLRAEADVGASLTISTDGADGGTIDEPSLTRWSTAATWSRYEIDIVPDATGVPVVSVTVDGISALSPSSVRLPSCGVGGDVIFSVGNFCADQRAKPAREVWIDDIAFFSK